MDDDPTGELFWLDPNQRAFPATVPRFEFERSEPLAFLEDVYAVHVTRDGGALGALFIHGLVDTIDLEADELRVDRYGLGFVRAEYDLSFCELGNSQGSAIGPRSLTKTTRPTPPNAKWASHCSLVSVSRAG